MLSPLAPIMLFCPVCDAPDVSIQPDTLNDTLDLVDCPRCLRYLIDREAPGALSAARSEPDLPDQLDFLSDYLRLRPADDNASVSLQNWRGLAEQGRRLRRDLQPDTP